MRRIMQSAVVLAVLAASPAQAGCWTPSEVKAARVQELDTMLMVAALRCRDGGSAMLVTYNMVVERHRTLLAAGNAQIRNHFTTAVGAKGMMAAYDTYVTRVANRHGGWAGQDCLQMTAIAHAVLAEPSSLDTLDAHAQRAAIEAVAVEQQCEVTLETLVIAEARRRAAGGPAAPTRLAMVPPSKI